LLVQLLFLLQLCVGFVSEAAPRLDGSEPVIVVPDVESGTSAGACGPAIQGKKR